MPDPRAPTTTDRLRRWLQGQTTPQEIAEVERWLMEAALSEEEVEQILREDGLVSRLREPSQVAPAQWNRPQVQQLIRRIQESHSRNQHGTRLTAEIPNSQFRDNDLVSREFPLWYYSPHLSEPVRYSRYWLLHVLGSGGMARVYRAEDTRLKRNVALKLLKPELASSTLARERFLREAQAAAALKHSNVVTIFDVGEELGIPFLTMGLLEGECLDARLQHEKMLTTDEAIWIAQQIARGVGKWFDSS